MSPTHIMKGGVLSLPLFNLFPEYKVAIFISLTIGFSIPDLDLFIGIHRKTIHYPCIGAIPTLASVFLVMMHPTVLAVSVLLLCLGIWIHSVSDIFGGAVEDEPWKATKHRVVYNHVTGKWINARRTIPYDGSPRDLLVFILLSCIFLLLYPLDITTNEVVFVCLLSMVAVFYTAFRRTLFSPVYMEKNHPKLKRLSDRIRGN